MDLLHLQAELAELEGTLRQKRADFNAVEGAVQFCQHLIQIERENLAAAETAESQKERTCQE